MARGIKSRSLANLGSAGTTQAGIPFVYQFATTAGATNTSTAIRIDQKCRLIDFYAVCTSEGGTSVTYQALNGTDVAAGTSGTLGGTSDALVDRAVLINDAYHTFDPGDTMSAKATAAGSDAPSAICYATCVRI